MAVVASVASCTAPPVPREPAPVATGSAEVRSHFDAFARFAECTAVNAETTLGHALENLLGPRRHVPTSTLAQCITTPRVPVGHQTPMMPERLVIPAVSLTGVSDASLEELVVELRRMRLSPTLFIDSRGKVIVGDPAAGILLEQAKVAPSAYKDELSAQLRARKAMVDEVEARLDPLGVALRDAAVASQSSYVFSLNIVFHAHLPDDAEGIDDGAARILFEEVMANAVRADRCQAAAAGLLALAQAIFRGKGEPADLALAVHEVQLALREPWVVSPDDLAEAWNPAMAKAARMREEIAALVREERRQGIAPPRAPSQVWAATEFGAEKDLAKGIGAVLSGDVVAAIRAGDVLFDGQWPIREGVHAVAAVMIGDGPAALLSAKVLVAPNSGVGRALAVADRVVTTP